MAIKCVCGALACVGWVVFVVAFTHGDFTRPPGDGFWVVTFYGSLVAAPLLAIAGGVIALSSREEMKLWKRFAVIGVGFAIPAVAVWFIVALLNFWDSLN